jgi:MOSC domain-containing protein YiiM
MFGETFTTEGLLEKDINIGDRCRMDVRLEPGEVRQIGDPRIR